LFPAFWSVVRVPVPLWAFRLRNQFPMRRTRPQLQHVAPDLALQPEVQTLTQRYPPVVAAAVAAAVVAAVASARRCFPVVRRSRHRILACADVFLLLSFVL